MSDRNVERHRRAIEAVNARDIDAGLALSDPQIELQTMFTAVGGGVYQGHDGMRTFQREFEEVWGDEFLIEPQAFFGLGERSLACTVWPARGRQSGAEVTIPAAQVARWRDGLCVHFKAYAHRE